MNKIVTMLIATLLVLSYLTTTVQAEESCATFDNEALTLDVPCLDYGKKYSLKLELIDPLNLTFKLTEMVETQSIQEKALMVLEALETGDADVLAQYISADTYIQHNLSVPDGRQALLDMVNNGMLDGTTVETVRMFTDGNIVVAHSDYFFMGAKQVGIDVFRFENGLIVEHWDNLQVHDGNAISDVNGNTMLNGATEIADSELTDANKTLVQNFVQNILVGGDTSQFDTYFNEDDGTGNNYIQHNPEFPNGLGALKGYLQSLESAGTPFYNELHAVYGMGNFVLTLSEGNINGPSTSYFDLFRVADGKIVEHWDTIQEIPDESQWANSNGKF